MCLQREEAISCSLHSGGLLFIWLEEGETFPTILPCFLVFKRTETVLENICGGLGGWVQRKHEIKERLNTARCEPGGFPLCIGVHYAFRNLLTEGSLLLSSAVLQHTCTWRQNNSTCCNAAMLCQRQTPVPMHRWLFSHHSVQFLQLQTLYETTKTVGNQHSTICILNFKIHTHTTDFLEKFQPFVLLTSCVIQLVHCCLENYYSTSIGHLPSVQLTLQASRKSKTKQSNYHLGEWLLINLCVKITFYSWFLSCNLECSWKKYTVIQLDILTELVFCAYLPSWIGTHIDIKGTALQGVRPLVPLGQYTDSLQIYWLSNRKLELTPSAGGRNWTWDLLHANQALLSQYYPTTSTVMHQCQCGFCYIPWGDGGGLLEVRRNLSSCPRVSPAAAMEQLRPVRAQSLDTSSCFSRKVRPGKDVRIQHALSPSIPPHS